MKTLIKSLLVASAIVLPAASYAGAGHEHETTESTNQQIHKECKKGEDCPMAKEMNGMSDEQMKEHMKKMNGEKRHDDKHEGNHSH